MQSTDRQTTTTEDPEAGTYGVQWKTIGGGLAVFWLSCVVTYFLRDEGADATSRTWAALRDAGIIFLVAMFGMRVLRAFLSRERLSSNTTFLVVWVLAFLVWFFWNR